MKSLLYAHEGCYLSLPDDRYQTHDSPFFDEELVKKETRLLKEEIAGAAAFGCTGFVHLMAGIEDFISYRFMNHPQADRREVRAQGLSRALRELIDFAHDNGMEYFIQNYELLFDSWVAEHLTESDMHAFLLNRYKEFFDITGVDGVVVTPSEVHNRGGCRYVDFRRFYNTISVMAGDFLSVITESLGKKLRFRLWLHVMNESDWRKMQIELPKNLVVTVKNTAGDFWVGAGQNPVITHSDKSQKLSVIFDIYGQYHGWGRLLYIDPDWPEQIRNLRERGNFEIQAWGSWSPSCIWPNEDTNFLAAGYKHCAALYHENGIWAQNRLGARFAFGYLLSLLEDESTQQNAVIKTSERCGLDSDVDRLANIFPHVKNLWKEYYLPASKGFYPLLSGWTMIFQLPRKTWRDFLRNEGRHIIYRSNDSMKKDLEILMKEGRRLKSTELAEIWRLTELFFETQILIREAACIDPSFADEDLSSYNSTRTQRLEICDRLQIILKRWKDFPVEAVSWCMTDFDASRLAVRPYWLRAGSLQEYEKILRLDIVREIPEEDAFGFYAWDGK